MKRLEGKTALIVGAARGIARAFPEAHVAESARGALPGIDIAWARQSAEEMATAAIVVEIDGARQDFIGASVAKTMAAPSGSGILIKNATIIVSAPIDEIARDDCARVRDINVAGTLFILQAVAWHMMERGKSGSAMVVASRTSRCGESVVAACCASNSAVSSLSQSAGLILVQHRINVNAIAPGVVDGEHRDGVYAFIAKHEGSLFGRKKRDVGSSVSCGCAGRTGALAGRAVFLASDEADCIVVRT
ncbi:MAG: SDR family NAD(P)-dependent oxidoreductase [Boseongicola sp. SB0675_bin_26]|nr:SDR family NAD(P)-dependent oxidoreductase [Boseongicola sp. SB0675_bin_26]